MQIHLILNGGIGVSLIQNMPPKELLYFKLSTIVFEFQSNSHHRTVDCSIKDIQVDNQLVDAQCPVVLYVTPQSKNDDTRHLPALHLSAYQMISPNLNALIFKNFIVAMKNLTLTIEEALLCKLLLLGGCDQSDTKLEKVDEQHYEPRRMLAAATSANATRYYFRNLTLMLNQIRLSVLTSKNLSPELKSIRRKMGLTLVRFENAQVNLSPFEKNHPFETSKFLVDCIVKHYREVSAYPNFFR